MSARREIPARAGDPAGRFPDAEHSLGRVTGVSSLNSAPAGSSEASGGGAFWEAVVSGTVRLSAAEDRMVWDLRAAHWRWDYIAGAIMRRRADASLRVAAMSAGRAQQNARRWREQFRRERA